MAQPEEQARAQIDELLTAAGWVVTDPSTANLGAARGVVIRNFPLKSGHGFADYLFYVDPVYHGTSTCDLGAPLNETW